MASFNLLLNHPKDKDGTLKKTPQTIYLWVNMGRMNKLPLNTGIKVLPANWNFKAKRFSRSEKGSTEKNAQLEQILANVQVAYNDNRTLHRDELKKVLAPIASGISGEERGSGEELPANPRMSDVLIRFQQTMQNEVSANYLRGLQPVLNFIHGKRRKSDQIDKHVAQVRDVLVKDAGEDYVKNYRQWMISAGYQNSTILKHIEIIKNVLNRLDKSIEVDSSFKHARTIKVPRKKPFWLKKEEVQLLIDHQFTWVTRVTRRDIKRRLDEWVPEGAEKLDRIMGLRRDSPAWERVYEEVSKELPEFFSTILPYKERVKDEFLFRYYTGMRQQEPNELEPRHFVEHNGVLHVDFTMMKNSREFLMPINDRAKAILDKYRYRLPIITQQQKDAYISVCFREAGLKGEVERVSFSGSARVAKWVDKCDAIGTHTARRSFGRRWVESGGSIDSLCDYFGQSSPAVTKVYIGYELEEYTDMVRNLEF